MTRSYHWGGQRRHALDHGWPANVRESRDYALECVSGSDGDATASDIQDLPARVAEFETAVIIDALRASGGKVV
ncbi:DNA-binding NtrC family response regulator [Sphingomonas insulae]|uniref:hypothetical protein n=1 Tax=Sphingomonas insulae TaxID=424800 RepID=UPI0013D144BA|nr:hypothetical protein [Sphingomonas insulae]NIJ30808.1 DNA-binding NtrC family response regulator [Sphingomonas insulae]